MYFRHKSYQSLSINIHNFLQRSLKFSLAALLLLLSTSITFAALIPPPPTIQASSYILMDADSGKILMNHNVDKRLPPASLTKIMTSYVIEYEMDSGNIQADDLVPISVKAWRKGGSKMYVREGTKVPLIDLLRGIIIQSGNDASIAAAEYIAGSEEAFADLMNQHAKRLGMANSNFKNATGWPEEGHYSSAKDMAILSQALIRDFPQHYSIYAEKSFTYNQITQSNRNSLLQWSDSVDGIKTGHTEDAGYCLVASAKEGDMRLISVVTGTSSPEARAEDSKKMLTYGFRFFETQKIHDKETLVTTARVWKGDMDGLNVGVAEDVYITFPRGQYDEITQHIQMPPRLVAPISTGDRIGEISLKLDEEVLASTSLVAQNTIQKGNFFMRLLDTIWLFFSGLFN